MCIQSVNGQDNGVETGRGQCPEVGLLWERDCLLLIVFCGTLEKLVRQIPPITVSGCAALTLRIE